MGTGMTSVSKENEQVSIPLDTDYTLSMDFTSDEVGNGLGCSEKR